METSASFEARYAPPSYPHQKEPTRTPYIAHFLIVSDCSRKAIGTEAMRYIIKPRREEHRPVMCAKAATFKRRLVPQRSEPMPGAYALFDCDT
jgi:hypothetical protein